MLWPYVTSYLLYMRCRRHITCAPWSNCRIICARWLTCAALSDNHAYRAGSMNGDGAERWHARDGHRAAAATIERNGPGRRGPALVRGHGPEGQPPGGGLP